MNVILASQSPRRKELLSLLQIPFTVRAADIDESMASQADPAAEVARVSRLKAEAIPASPDQIVIAADTIVVCDGQLLGKPRDEDDAFRMLHMLSGRAHQVMTGLTVRRGDTVRSYTEITDVYFRPLSEEEIRAYIRTKDPMDKAGSYGIQSGGAVFVEKLSGDYYNVVGLPVCRLYQILKEFTEESR